METYLNKLGYDFLTIRIKLPRKLEKIIESQFILHNDCIIINGLYGHTENPNLETDLEKCEWEYNETHFHVDMYYKNKKEEIEYLKLALECAKRISDKLNNEFENRKFRITVSFSETLIKDEEIEFYGSGVVRFNQIRTSCENAMRIADLNDYKLDAVLEIEN